MALASVCAVAFVSAEAIDHDLARGLEPRGIGHPQPSGFAVLLGHRPLLMFAVCCAPFHLANASMLPLVSQKLAQANLHMATFPDARWRRRGGILTAMGWRSETMQRSEGIKTDRIEISPGA